MSPTTTHHHDTSTDVNTASRTTDRTEHYARQTNTSKNPRTRATRSNESHLGIPISWSGPASGRRQRPRRHVDLPGAVAVVLHRLAPSWRSPWF